MKNSIREKIILSFLGGIIVGTVIWALSYHYHDLIGQEFQFIEKKHIFYNTILETRRNEKNYLLFSETEYIERTLSSVEKAEEMLNEINRVSGQYQYPSEKEYGGWIKDLARYKESLTTLLQLHDQINSTGVTKEIEEIREKIEKEKLHLQILGRTINAYVERAEAREYENVQQMIRKSKYYHLETFLALSILAALTALFLLFNVNRPLKTIENAIHKIAKGDNRNIPTISTGDEFESLVTSLNTMIKEMNKRSEVVLQTEKMASLGILTSGVAHELNNPLNNISSSVQILLEELEDADTEYKRTLLIDMEKQTERARDTIKSLLEFSRKSSFSPQLVHVENLLFQTLKLIKGEVPTNVTINLDVTEDLEAYLDPRLMQHVLINFILNAVQAMEEGGDITIKAFRRNGTFCFQVQDTGSGIAEKNLPKIFDPFFTTKEVGKGTGLGLSVCHGIVDQHGGRIEVSSILNKGTTFSVFLPHNSGGA